MDPLPIVVNQRQLQLLHEQVSHRISQIQSEQFNNQDNPSQEQNLEIYGTDRYEEARALVQAIDDELESHLQSWNESPEAVKPIAIALNSYQVKVLRSSIQQGLNGEAKKMLEDVIQQLPEESPQEDAD